MIGLAASLLLGCLPPTSLSRGDQLKALRYDLTLGPDAAGNASTQELTRQYVRTFRDSTSGWLVCLETAGVCVEVRSFPSGAILAIRGASHFAPETRGALVALWPLLSPWIGKTERFVTSWPLATRGSLRSLGRGPWRREGNLWAWSPSVTLNTDVPNQPSGRLDATLVLDADGTRWASWSLNLPMCRAENDCRVLASVGSLTRRGHAAHRGVAPCAGYGADVARAPLCLADGTVIDDAEDAQESVFFASAPAPGSATWSGEPR